MESNIHRVPIVRGKLEKVREFQNFSKVSEFQNCSKVGENVQKSKFLKIFQVLKFSKLARKTGKLCMNWESISTV